MFCSRKTADPLVEALYAEDKLMLLARGWSPDKLYPGIFMRKPPARDAREIVAETPETLFSNWVTPESEVQPYRRLGRRTTSAMLDVGSAMRLAPVLTGSSVSGKLAASVKNLTSKRMSIALRGASLNSMSLGRFEAGMRELHASDLGMRYMMEGHRFFLVTDTLAVTSAELSMEDEAAAAGLLEAMGEGVGSVGFEAKADRSSGTCIVLDPGRGKVVVAFRALEAVCVDGVFRQLKGLQAPMSVRGETERYGIDYVDIDDLQDADTSFLSLAEAEAEAS